MLRTGVRFGFFFMHYPDGIHKTHKKNIPEGKEDAFLTVRGIKVSHFYKQTSFK